MLQTLKLEDTSPVINFDSQWKPGDPSIDGAIINYSDSTFMLTQTSGASATLTFNGTRVVLYGARRSNHDFYRISMDGNLTAWSGRATPDQFQAVLFDSGELPDGNHTIILADDTTNADPAQSYLDLDFATIESQVGDHVRTVDDTDSSFSYQPAGAWNTSPDMVASFMQGTGHTTTAASAFVTLNFTGDAIDVYGLVSPSSGPFSVALDGGVAAQRTANRAFKRTQQVLYSVRSLPGGAHSLVFANTPQNGASTSLSIDYAQVYSSSVPSSPTSPQPTPQPKSSNVGVIVGAVLGSIGGVTLLVLAVLCIRDRRRMRGRPAKLRPRAEEKSPPIVLPKVASGTARTALHETISPFYLAPFTQEASSTSQLVSDSKQARVQQPLSAPSPPSSGSGSQLATSSQPSIPPQRPPEYATMLPRPREKGR